jgi:hypothetical protein
VGWRERGYLKERLESDHAVEVPLLFGDRNNAGDCGWRWQTRACGGAVNQRGRERVEGSGEPAAHQGSVGVFDDDGGGL